MALPETVALARQLRGEKKSLRQISEELLARGRIGQNGRAIAKDTVSKIVDGVLEVPQGCRPW
jgi:hypothetical protein